MSKRSLSSKSGSSRVKQGNILSFVKAQPSSDLLKSKDGLKQGRIDPYLRSKYPPKDPVAGNSRSQRKKRPLSEDSNNMDMIKSPGSAKKRRQSSSFTQFIPETPPESVIAASPAVDSTVGEKVERKQRKAKKSLSSKLAIIPVDLLKTAKSQASHESMEHSVYGSGRVVDREDHDLRKESFENVGNDISETETCIDENEGEDTVNGTDKQHLHEIENGDDQNLPKNASANLSVDDLDLNDSFLNAALDGISPMKTEATKGSTSRLLACSVPCSSTTHSLAKFRHRLLSISDGEGGFPSKVLVLENVATKRKVNCVLSHRWIETRVMEGDVVNLIVEDQTENETVHVNNNKNLIVTHPDILLSGTTVSNAIGCKRRAVLGERFKNTESGDAGKPIMLIGTIVHSIFQKVIQVKTKMSANEILALAKEEISKSKLLKDILSLGTTQQEILKRVSEFIPQIVSWVGEYVRGNPTIGVGKLDLKLPPGHEHSKLGIDSKSRGGKFATNVALAEVRDIEENVWSPLYGLKGKIDVTADFIVRRQTEDRRTHHSKVTLPLELKTGRESHSTEHHAQVAIYAMFTAERRKMPNRQSTIPTGLLLYLKTGDLSCVPLKRDDERELTMIRNEVSSYLVRNILEKRNVALNGDQVVYGMSPLPPTLDNGRFCRNCSQLRNCSLVYKTIDRDANAYKPSAEMVDLIEGMTCHLGRLDFEYFEHWVTCMLLETRESLKKDLNQYYWTRSPNERQANKLCVTNLKLAGESQPSSDGVTVMQTFKISSKGNNASVSLAIFSIGDMVVVSGTEPAYIAMATATVDAVNENFITIITDRNFAGYPHNMVYSIDRHQWPSVSSFNASFRNLSVIMDTSTTAGSLRDLIIHHREPSFKAQLQEVIPRSSKDDVAKMLRGLNRTQRQAIKRVLLSQDYTLVVGMPGSGKTTTIVAMVRILLLCGCRVLLTSYTHSAIDNLLIKLIKYKVKFLRLGRTSQIHPAVRKFSEEELTKNAKTPEELDRLYSQASVVGCTCLAVTSHVLFSSPTSEPSKRSRFDVCVVDEASQISQPACLAPLLHANRFVLVGDHRQLPPLVRSRKARSMGADESLFWRLSHHKVALCDLTLQYRMNRTIMDVSNYVTYEGRLECASESVAKATLDVPNLTNVVKSIEDTTPTLVGSNGNVTYAPWLPAILDPDRPVWFLDTSKLQAYEEEVENGICNKTEAEILKLVVEHLLQAGCPSDDIGIIAPFRRQLKTIEDCMASLNDDSEKLEINTVDKYQGRDKNVILLSFVRCRRGELGDKKGELLSDWRRLNVALTRAKHKMVLVGCQKTLTQYEPCKKLLEYLNKHEMIMTL